jgi:hypothetical protein
MPGKACVSRVGPFHAETLAFSLQITTVTRIDEQIQLESEKNRS